MRIALILMFISTISLGVIAEKLGIRYQGPEPDNAGLIERLIHNGASVDSVQAVLRAAGYLDAAAMWDGDAWLVAAGERHVLAEVIFIRSGDTTSVASGRRFTQAHFNRIVDSVLGRLQADGYYYASGQVVSLSREETSVRATVRVTDGPFVTVENVRLRGLRRSRRAVIERYLPLRPGDTVTAPVLREASRAADDIPFVRHLGPPVVRPRPGYTAVDVEFNFEEQQPLSLEVGGGYVPDQESEFVWYFDGTLNNLFGGGREARLLSERREEGRQVLQVGYGQPIFLLGIGRVSLGAATRDYRDAFYEFEISGAYETRFTPEVSLGVAPGYRSVEPSGAAPSFASYRLGFSTRWERLDDPFNPRTGISARTTISWSHRRYDDDSSAAEISGAVFNETRTDLNLGIYRPIAGPIIGHVTLRYEGLETAEELPPLSELILLGGPGSIRGYRNEQFAVLRAALITVEPRVRFESGFLFAFYDGAYLNNRTATNNGIITDEDYRSGYGLGLGLTDGRRSVRVALGWNPDVALDEARLSIRLISNI